MRAERVIVIMESASARCLAADGMDRREEGDVVIGGVVCRGKRSR